MVRGFEFHTAQNIRTNRLVLSRQRSARSSSAHSAKSTGVPLSSKDRIYFTSVRTRLLPSYHPLLSIHVVVHTLSFTFSTFRDKLTNEYSSHAVWNIACGFAQNTPELLVFRFLAGLGGSAPLSVRLVISSSAFVSANTFFLSPLPLLLLHPRRPISPSRPSPLLRCAFFCANSFLRSRI